LSGETTGRTQYYLAASLDGFLAETDDGLDWLYAYGDSGDEAQAEFLAGVGALAMGARTYEVILRNHPGEWAYGSLPTWVFTRRRLDLPATDDAAVSFVSGPVADTHPTMVAAARDANVWVVGGGNLAAQFVEAGLLDELLVTFVPDLLGAGIAYLPRRLLKRLRLTGTRALGNGMVELRYEVVK
jgi:dihydrofolate reductase